MPQICHHDGMGLKAESYLCLISELMSVLSCISEAMKRVCSQWISHVMAAVRRVNICTQ